MKLTKQDLENAKNYQKDAKVRFYDSSRVPMFLGIDYGKGESYSPGFK